MTLYHTILCPTDFSEPAGAALSHAEDLARQYGAELIVAHVVEPLILPLAYGSPPSALHAYEQSAHESAARQMKLLISALRARGVNARPVVSYGSAFDEVCRLVVEEKVDLVVLGTHGHGGIKRAFLGSTADRLIRSCACPVLAVRSTAAKEGTGPQNEAKSQPRPSLGPVPPSQAFAPH
jgi:nucleotide-binding universal stress UspA family protein